jgi:hypothetical protein
MAKNAFQRIFFTIFSPKRFSTDGKKKNDYFCVDKRFLLTVGSRDCA